GLRDPTAKRTAVKAVYDRDEIYFGPAFDEAPDLQVGMETGYRVSWQSTLGGISPDLFTDNVRKWSGDHCSLDTAITPGILLCNRPITAEQVSLLDLAPTVLSLLGIHPPSSMDGRPIPLGTT
ncbi:MAG: nucleotide pyrophosphatase, partial [Candidatus Coatesbacteria bacterium]|nr:nucleotide pyrophosphatase [Candidatus Coatesbacteria bacterium]